MFLCDFAKSSHDNALYARPDDSKKFVSVTISSGVRCVKDGIGMVRLTSEFRGAPPIGGASSATMGWASWSASSQNLYHPMVCHALPSCQGMLETSGVPETEIPFEGSMLLLDAAQHRNCRYGAALSAHRRHMP